MLFVVRCSDEASPPPLSCGRQQKLLPSSNSFFTASTMCMTPSIPCYHQKKVLRCCNAHPAANNQKRNAFFISGFRDTLTQSLKMFLILQTFYEIVGKVKIILRTTYLLFSYPRVAGSNQTGLWVHPSTCSQSIPKSRCYSH